MDLQQHFYARSR